MHPSQDVHSLHEQPQNPLCSVDSYPVGNVSAKRLRAIIVEDTREACIALRQKGYDCDRITHNELMASTGEEYTAKLLKGDYDLLWISTPSDWYVRTPGKRTNPHWQRLQTWMQKAATRQMKLVMFGPPGFLWKLPNIRDSIIDLKLNTARLRLCHFGEKHDKDNALPSGSYIQVVTNEEIPHKAWQCGCKQSIQEHVLDWYGKTQEHANWRRKISSRLTAELCSKLFQADVGT